MVSPVEIAWVLVTALGVAINLWAYHDARDDYRFLKQAGINGERALVAHQNSRNEAIRILKQALMMALGIWGMTQPPLAGSQVSAFAPLVLIGVEALMLGGSILDRRDRQRLIAEGIRERDVKR